jgi:hypothetical protein
MLGQASDFHLDDASAAIICFENIPQNRSRTWHHCATLLIIIVVLMKRTCVKSLITPFEKTMQGHPQAKRAHSSKVAP